MGGTLADSDESPASSSVPGIEVKENLLCVCLLPWLGCGWGRRGGGAGTH